MRQVGMISAPSWVRIPLPLPDFFQAPRVKLGAFCYNEPMNPIQLMGALAITFGILVIIFPSLIGILVGIFFIILGVNILAFGNKFNRLR